MRKFLALILFLVGCDTDSCLVPRDAGDVVCIQVCADLSSRRCIEICYPDGTDTDTDTTTVSEDAGAANSTELQQETDTDTDASTELEQETEPDTDTDTSVVLDDAGVDASVVPLQSYFVDSVLGDDSNPGTFELPWRSTTPFSSAEQAPDISLQPGDTVYLRAGMYTTVAQGTDNMYVPAWLNLHYVHGESSAPITIRNYPGEHVIIDPAGQGMGVFFLNSSFVNVVGLDIREAYYRGISVDLNSNEVNIDHCSISSTDGWVGDNIAGVEFRLAKDCSLTNSIIFDNYDRVSAAQNNQTENSCNVFLHRGEGTITVADNVIYQTGEPGSEYSGCGLKHKHSSVDHDFELRVERNYFENHRFAAIGISTNNAVVQDNVVNGVYNYSGWGPGHAIDFRDWGGLTHLTGARVDHNTVISDKPFFFYPTDINSEGEGAPWEDLSDNVVSDNVFVATDSNVQDPPIEIYTAIDDRIYELAAAGTSFEGNCYFLQTGGDMQFGFAEDTSFGELGGRYDFLGWQLEYGWDFDGSEGDPQLNSSFMPTSESCSGKGVRSVINRSKVFVPPM